MHRREIEGWEDRECGRKVGLKEGEKVLMYIGMSDICRLHSCMPGAL